MLHQIKDFFFFNKIVLTTHIYVVSYDIKILVLSGSAPQKGNMCLINLYVHRNLFFKVRVPQKSS